MKFNQMHEQPYTVNEQTNQVKKKTKHGWLKLESERVRVKFMKFTRFVQSHILTNKSHI